MCDEDKNLFKSLFKVKVMYLTMNSCVILLRKCRPKLGVLDEPISQESRSVPPYATRETVSSAYNAHRTKVCVLCFYETACCQAPFLLYTLVTPSVVNRASGFLKREASICLERTSIRAGFSLPDTRCCIRPKAIREAPG